MSATMADGVVVTVEIGFSTTAGSGTIPLNSTLASITWTDISQYVRDVSIKRGRSSELDDFTTGNCQVVLDNRTRIFDPEYSAGTYFGKLTPGRPIRIKATPAGGVEAGIFFGFIDQWDQQYNFSNDAIANVTASDAFKIMNNITLPSYWEWAIQNTSIAIYPSLFRIWHRFDDATGVSSPRNSQPFTSTYNWVTTAGASSSTTLVDGLIANDTNGAASFDGTKYLKAIETFTGYGPAVLSTLTAGCWIKTTSTTTGRMGVISGDSGFTTQYGIGVVVAGGVGTITAWAENKIVNVGTVVNDGLPHLVVIQYEDGASKVWVDGVPTLISTGSTYTPVDITEYTIGGPATFSTTARNNFTSSFDGAIDEYFQFQDAPLSNADVTMLYGAGKGTYLNGQTTSARIASLLQMAYWMTDGTNLTTGGSVVQPIDTQGQTLLLALKECETAEQGRLFIDGNGKVAFISRNATATTAIYKNPQRTFGDSTGELPYTQLQFTYNDQLVKNRVTVGRTNGLTFTANDTTSQGQYFVRTDSINSLINNSDQDVADIANYRIAVYKQPALRIESMTINPRANVSLYSGCIGDEIGTRITVNRRPQNIGSVISKQLIIEGVSHKIGFQTWETIYNLSPTPLPFLILNDTTYGVIDSINVLGY